VKTAWVCVGRTGDCCNALPLVYHDYQQGNRPTVVIGEEWSGLMDGVGYADKLVWHGNYSRPLEAAKFAESLNQFDQILVPQCYGQSFKRECPSFCEEAYRLAGMRHLFGRLPLVFDRRNREREQALIPAFTKPFILVNTEGISSAFPKGKELLEVLKPLRETHEIVDMSLVKAHRFYDLLGLYDKAEYLVCIDSGPLHLAQAAPDLKVIAMISDSPDSWYGSPARKNHVLRIRYGEFDARKQEIPEAIRLKKKSEPKLIHVWSKYHINKPDARKRHNMAKLTWEREMGSWIDMPLEDSFFKRNARTDFNNIKSAPYVTDMIDAAMEKANLWDIVVITNDDTCVTPNLTRIVRDVLAGCGACWGARREHRLINHPMTSTELMQGYKHCGADIFCFTKEWWIQHGHNMPDMLMAFENWDYVLRTVVNENGGREIEGLCYHEIHQGDWLTNRSASAAKHNQQMSGEFFSSHKFKDSV
jgi:hypothetical protein